MLKSIEKLRSIRASVRKATTPGARILSSMLPARGVGWPGGWGADRMEQVMHFRNWNYVSIHTICSKIGMLTPNIAYLHHAKIPGKTTKYAETIRDFGGTNFASLGGVVTPTTGFMYRKSLGVVKPHEDLEPVEFDHPLRRLIENPNQMDTSYDLFYELQLFMELCGVAYLWMVPNGWGIPCELWVIPSHWVWPRTNGGGLWDPSKINSDLIDYYEVRPWGGTGSAGMLKFPAKEVLMFAMKSPLNKLDGWSPQTAGAMWIDTEESIVKSRWAQMCNQARADVHIEVPGDMNDPDDERITRIEAKFMQKYQGELNYGKPIFTPAGTKVTPLSFSPQEMAYFQCFDEKTECLTAEGWKKYDELTPATRVACYDPDTGKLVYRVPSAIHIKPYKGKMYRWEGQRVDATMTPNHRVYVNRPTTRSVGGKLTTKRTQYRDSSRISKVRVGNKIINEKVWDIKRVEELAPKTSYGILAAAPAACDTPTAIMLEKFEGWRQREEKDAYRIDPEIWLTFLGHYLSEGWASCREVGNGTNGWEIGVCQKKYVERFRESLASTPFSWREGTREDGVVYWNTSDKGLYNHLVAHCGKGALNKRIPDYVKAWPAEYLQILLDALLEGDGTPKSQNTKGRGGRTRGKERSPRKDKKSWHAQYYTSSRQLADDVMEIAVKCGLFAALTVKEDPREEYLGRERFTINIASRTEIEVCAHNRSEVEYEGNIWCVTVPTGLFVVRRNGKAHITGNSEEQARDMVLALRQFPKTAAGISNDMTFGAVLATAASLCSNSINPRLMPLGLRLTKDLAPRFATEGNPIRVWWDDTSPADPQQVNSDIATDLQCILPGQEIQGRIIGGSKAWYSGKAVKIRTASGATLSVTRNHPVLTVMGFIDACQLKKGQNLLGYVNKSEFSTLLTERTSSRFLPSSFLVGEPLLDPLSFGHLDEQYAPTLVEEVFETLLSTWPSLGKKVSTVGIEFHGDAKGFKGQIHVVGSYCELWDRIVPNVPKRLSESDFVRLSGEKAFLSAPSHLHQVFGSELLPQHGFTNSSDPSSFAFGSSFLPSRLFDIRQDGADFGVTHSDFGGFGGTPNLDTSLLKLSPQPHVTNTQIGGDFVDGFPGCVAVCQDSHIGYGFGQEFLSFGPAANLDVSGKQALFDNPRSGTELARELIDMFPGEVLPDEIIDIEFFHYDGPVYDFESPLGYIIVESLLVSNCNAITPNEVRALRGRPAYKNGGNDPMVSGPGGMVPLPLNTGEDLTEIGELVPAYPKDDVGDEGGGVGGDDHPEGDDGGGDYGGMGEAPKPKLSAPRIESPNNGGSLSVSNLSKGWTKDRGNGDWGRLHDAIRGMEDPSSIRVYYQEGPPKMMYINVMDWANREDEQAVRSAAAYVVGDEARVMVVNEGAKPGEGWDEIKCDGKGDSPSRYSKGYKMTHEEWIENSGVTKVQKAREFSSTQFDLNGFPKIRAVLEGFQAAISQEDLTGDGLEDDFHVTVKYGLRTENIEDVRKIVEGFGPVTVRLGKVSVFEKPDEDVVKVEVLGDDIHRLNALLSQLPHKDTFPVYKPHVTLAYVKPGSGAAYLSPRETEGAWATVTLKALTFSDKDGFKTRIPLGEWVEKTPNKGVVFGSVTKSARQLVESLPDSVFEGGSPANIPLSYITLDSGAVSRTRRDIKEGRVNTSGRPVALQWNGRTGLLTVEDGMHRIVAAMDSGKSIIQAYIEDVTPAKAIKSWDSMEDGGVTKPEEPQPGDVVDKCGGEGGTPGPCPEEGGDDPKNPKGGKKESGAKFPKVGSSVTVDGARYVVEPLDGDDTFPPAIASYEIKDGYVLYTARNGGEGIVSGSPKDLAKWMLDVRKELQATPTADTTPRAWTPEDGGKENLQAAEDTVAKTAAAFGISTPKVTHAVATRALESGSHSPGHVTLQNSYQSTPNTSLNFDTDTSYENHIAAHETVHSVFSDKTDISRKYMEELSRSKDKVSVYHALAGNFEGLMDLGAAYIHSPEQLKRYSPELFDIANRWAAETRGATNGKGFQSNYVKGSSVLRDNANRGGNSGARAGRLQGLFNVGLPKEVRRDGKGRTQDGNVRELDRSGVKGIRGVSGYFQREFPEGVEKAETEEKCGGEGGTPGPCPEEGSTPAAPSKKPPARKGPHVDSAKEVVAQMESGSATLDDLEKYTATLRELSPTKLRAVADSIGLDSSEIDPGDLRSQIGEKLNDIRIGAKGKPSPDSAPASSDSASDTETEAKPPSPERTRENAATAASLFDKLEGKGPTRNYVKLTDLRREMSDLSKTEFDAAINHLRREGGFTGGSLDGREGATREELDTAIRDDRGEGQTPTLITYLMRRNPKKAAPAKKKKRR